VGLLALGIGVAECQIRAGASSEQTGIATASAKTDGNVGSVKVGREPQDYKTVFSKTLGVIGEHFDQITYANRYDGRIEAQTIGPAKEPPTITRQAVVEIRSRPEGGFFLNVRIHKGIVKGTKWEPIGRDHKLERLILRRLNGQQDQTEKPSAAVSTGSTRAKEIDQKQKPKD
jgi:hypothetical protein